MRPPPSALHDRPALLLLAALLLPGAALLFPLFGVGLGWQELYPASGLLLALALLCWGYQERPEGATPAALFLLAYFLWEAAALGRAPEAAAGLHKLAGILPAALAALLAGQPTARTTLRALLPPALGGFAVALAFVGLYKHFSFDLQAALALAETTTPDPEMRRRLLHSLAQRRLYLLFGNSNQLAALFVLALPLLVVNLRRTRKWERAGWSLGLAAVLAALYCTKSRGGLLAAAATLALLAWRDELGLRLARSVKLGAAGGALLLFMLVVLFGSGRLRDAETLRARAEFWSVAAQMIRQQPLLGYGVEGYRFHYSEYRVPGGVEAQQPHNLPLEGAVEGGLVGALWAVALLVWLAALALRPGRDPVAGAAAVAAAAFGLQCLWDFHNSVPWLLLLFAVVFSLAEPPARLSARGRAGLALLLLATPAAAGFLPACAHWLETGRATLYSLALLAALGGGILAVRRARATGVLLAVALAVFSWDVLYAGSLSKSEEENGRLAWQRGDAMLARILLARAAQRQPYRPGPWAAQGMLSLQWNDHAAAERGLARAIELSPRTAHLHASRAELYLAMGRPGDARRAAARAARLHPARAAYRALLAEALAQLGQEVEAARQRAWAEKLDLLPDGGWLAPQLPHGPALLQTLPPEK